MGKAWRRRRARGRREGARRRQDRPGQGTSREPEAEGRCKSRGTTDAARRRQGQREVQARRCRRGPGRRQGVRDQEGRRRQAASEAKLALEPVSVFISRATQKLYVRRNTHKRLPDGGEMFDATSEVPVTTDNPDKPIGTHVFTAVARTEGGLRWTAVTIDSGDVAKAALDRITVPQDVLDRIAPTVLPRSSLIISDEPLHRETNYRTEFVIALNDQPQGGIINRPRSPDIRVTRRDDFGFGWGGWGFNNTFGRGGQYYDPRQNNRNYYQRSQRWF